jgi:histidinol dehydrogenase
MMPFPAFVASDLLSQAEHGADSQVILVSTSKKIDAVADVATYSNRALQRKLPKSYRTLN